MRIVSLSEPVLTNIKVKVSAYKRLFTFRIMVKNNVKPRILNSPERYFFHLHPNDNCKSLIPHILLHSEAAVWKPS